MRGSNRFRAARCRQDRPSLDFVRITYWSAKLRFLLPRRSNRDGFMRKSATGSTPELRLRIRTTRRPTSLSSSATQRASTSAAPRSLCRQTGQMAAFLDQAPFNSGSSFSGTLTFSSTVPVSVISLRGLNNERSEFLITTVPVVDLAATSDNARSIPHFADGGGWSTQIVIPPRSSFRVRTTSASSPVQTGSVRITPSANSRTPVEFAVFSLRSGGITVSEAGIQASTPTREFRLYAEVQDSIQFP